MQKLFLVFRPFENRLWSQSTSLACTPMRYKKGQWHKRYTIPLVIKEMPTKTTGRSHKMAKPKAGADRESWELLHTAGEKVKCHNHFSSFFKSLNISQDSVTLFQVCKRKFMSIQTPIWLFIHLLFRGTKNWKITQIPPRGEWIHKVAHSYHETLLSNKK